MPLVPPEVCDALTKQLEGAIARLQEASALEPGEARTAKLQEAKEEVESAIALVRAWVGKTRVPEA